MKFRRRLLFYLQRIIDRYSSGWMFHNKDACDSRGITGAPLDLPLILWRYYMEFKVTWQQNFEDKKRRV